MKRYLTYFLSSIFLFIFIACSAEIDGGKPFELANFDVKINIVTPPIAGSTMVVTVAVPHNLNASFAWKQDGKLINEKSERLLLAVPNPASCVKPTSMNLEVAVMINRQIKEASLAVPIISRWCTFRKIDDEVVGLAYNSQGDLYLATGNSLLKYHWRTLQEEPEVVVFQSNNSRLPQGEIKSLVIDGEDTVWLNIDNAAIVSFDDHQWTTYLVEHSAKVQHIVNTNGKLLIIAMPGDTRKSSIYEIIGGEIKKRQVLDYGVKAIAYHADSHTVWALNSLDKLLSFSLTNFELLASLDIAADHLFADANNVWLLDKTRQKLHQASLQDNSKHLGKQIHIANTMLTYPARFLPSNDDVMRLIADNGEVYHSNNLNVPIASFSRQTFGSYFAFNANNNSIAYGYPEIPGQFLLSHQRQSEPIKEIFTSRGIISNRIKHFQIAQNKLWVGTDKGLSVGDGNSFKQYLEGSHITVLAASKSGDVWAASRSGGILGKANGVTAYFAKQPSQHFTQSDFPKTIPSNDVHSIALLNDAAYVGTYANGIGNYAEGMWSHDVNVPNKQTVYALAFDDANVLWAWISADSSMSIGKSSQSGLYKLGISVKPFRNAPVCKGKVFLAANNDDNIWVGCAEHGIYLYNDAAEINWQDWPRWQDYSGLLPSNKVYGIYPGIKERLWVATDNGFTFITDKITKNQVFQKDNRDPYGLPSSQIKAIFQEQNGYVWVGTDEGLTRYYPW